MLSTSNLASDPDQWVADPLARYGLLGLANLASLLTCWGYLEIASATIFRNRSNKSVHWFIVLMFGASLGLLKGATTGLFSYLFGSELNLENAVLNRVLQTSILGLWTIPVVALVAATFARYRAERLALVNERVEAQIKDEGIKVDSDSQRQLQEFIKRSSETLDLLTREGSSSANSVAIASSLRDMVEKGLRPISHEIWSKASGQRSDFRLRDLATLALARNPFPLLFVGVGFLIGLFPLNLVIAPVGEALARTTLTLALALGVYGIFVYLNRLRRIAPAVLFVMGNTLATFLSMYVTATVFGDPIAEEFVFLAVALFLWLSQITLFGSLVQELVTSRGQIRSELIAITGRAGLNFAVALAASRINSRDLAQYVHSNVQNKLMSSVLKLETQTMSPEQLQTLISEVRSVLVTIKTRPTEAGNTLAGELRDIVSRWEGFANVSLEIGVSESEMDPGTSRIIVQIVSEAISNSVRHGLAKSIEVEIVRLESNPYELRIAVRDDGLGPRSGASGLGSELFSAVAGKGWTLTPRSSGGSILEMTITTLGSGENGESSQED